jgi:hypothetical protein
MATGPVWLSKFREVRIKMSSVRYFKKDGGRITSKEFEEVRKQFYKKWTTRFMMFLGLWSDSDYRRKLNKYFSKKGYWVTKIRGSKA